MSKPNYFNQEGQNNQVDGVMSKPFLPVIIEKENEEAMLANTTPKPVISELVSKMKLDYPEINNGQIVFNQVNPVLAKSEMVSKVKAPEFHADYAYRHSHF